ncbi:MAG: insulinase family protein [Phycisphaerae bacterium]|nr:insulinase family protein [Phycisphaerae bacterium]
MSNEFCIKEFPNGLTLLGEPMPNVSSVGFNVVIPGGSSRDGDDLRGAASVGAEWLLRGAGSRDSRALNEALDSLGVQHGEHAQAENFGFSATQLSRNLIPSLEIFADIILRPTLQGETFDPCRALIAQDLHGLDDEPARKCNSLLREKFFPAPLGYIPYGTPESLAAMTDTALRDHLVGLFSPHGTIIGVAGKFDWDEVCGAVEKLFGAWNGAALPQLQTTPAKTQTVHITRNSAQTHIALAHRAVISGDEAYYPARLAESVLSRGMGSRLFTEVREKRGLAYHVSSSYASLLKHAGMFTYAGTRPDQAPQTLEVIISELQRLADGITDEELTRAKTQIRSMLVMQGESTSARASSMCSDWMYLGRLRSLDEISTAVTAVTEKDVMTYLERFPADNFTILTIGPEELQSA